MIKKIEEVSVTPEIAAAWLERNTVNRPLMDRVAERYARSMRLGLWRLGPDPIIFDRDGNIINGQHRRDAFMRRMGF